LDVDPSHCSTASENVALVQRHAALVQPHPHKVSDECDSCVKHLSASGGCAPLVQYEDVSKYLPAGQQQTCKTNCKLDAVRFCLAEEGNGNPYKYLDEANLTATAELETRAGAGGSGEQQDLDHTMARKGPPPPPPPLGWGQCCTFLWGCGDCCDLCPGGNQWASMGDCWQSRRCNPAPTRRRRYRRRRDRRRRTPSPTRHPTQHPTRWPTRHPTQHPTHHPTQHPTKHPTNTPTHTPTNTPTNTPTSTPTSTPTNTPTSTPTSTPTNTPTATPTDSPTNDPTNDPTPAPTRPPRGCKAWCQYDTREWGHKCGWNICHDCHECGGHTGKCEQWCYNDLNQDWHTKCSYEKTCSKCEVCVR